MVSGIQWWIKSSFCREIVFHPFAGLFMSKSWISPHITLMINGTENTSANEWCFDGGCEKSPSAEILAFFTATSSLRNKIHALELYNDASKIVFENKKILSLSYTKEIKKTYSNRFKFWFFPPYFDGTVEPRLSGLFLWSQFGHEYLLVTIKIRSLFVYISLCKKI